MTHSKKWLVGTMLVLAMLISSLLLGYFMRPVQANAEAVSASVEDGYNANEDKALRQDSTQLISATREEYKDLQEYSYSKEIEAEMEETGMTVGESLVDQLCYYQQLLDSATDAQEISKINGMIEGTKNILDMYQGVATQRSTNASIDYPSSGIVTGGTLMGYAAAYSLASTAVPAAIAWFNASNYLLSAELLTQAWVGDVSSGKYYPIHGNRVVGSQTTYDFIQSNKTVNGISYTIYGPDAFNTATCYEEDLGFALHNVDVSRKSAADTKIRITDTYDFEVKEGYNAVLAALMRIFEIAQEYNIILNYEVVIDIDIADALYLKLNSTSNGAHSITAYNYSNKPLEVAYNTKMCNPTDAQLFQGLADISFISIPANGSKTISIKENAAASHITFCYIKDGYRIVTYADELYTDRNILNNKKKKSKAAANDIAIITKVGTQWLIQLTNIYGSRMKVEYNAKMCKEYDAKTWTGLKDIKSFYLNSGKSKFVYISENYSTHIAARFIGTTYEYYIYADQLSANGTMAIGRRSAVVYTYLTIENKGKSGGTWTIKITNPLSKGITVEYNSKMCNYGDARDWTGLKDVKSVYIPANGSTQVSISENWFATSIAISYLSNGNRLISYADGLNANGTMDVYHNKVGA